jgi:hypothetical protein
VLTPTIDELGDLYLACSTHLFENFERAGIAHWWENKPGAPKGAAIFTYYDAEKTCLRLMPNAPKLFQAAINSDLISQAQARLLTHELVTTLGLLVEEYSGCFAAEIKESPVGQCLRYVAEPQARSILTAHHNLGPDQLFAAMPWPLVPEVHFKLCTFSAAGIRRPYVEDASQNPLRAMGIATDLVTWGAGLEMQSIVEFLNWMRSKPPARPPLAQEDHFDWRKILIPCFVGGFQGMAFGLFCKLPPHLEQFVTAQLHQFSSTVGGAVARQRERVGALALSRASTLSDYAQAFKRMLPPTEHIVFAAGGEKIGFKLERQHDHLAGYRMLRGDELAAALADTQNAKLASPGSPGQPEIFAKFLANPDILSPVFTLLRLQPSIAGLPAFASTESVQALKHSELAFLCHSLQRQIKEGQGALAASKKLLLVEAALRDFEAGETVLSNNKARQFTERALGKPNPGYHVAGKAAKKFEEDIKKMMPQRFVFEAVSAHSVRVRWRPASEHSGNSEKVAQPRY